MLTQEVRIVKENAQGLDVPKARKEQMTDRKGRKGRWEDREVDVLLGIGVSDGEVYCFALV